MQRSKSRACLKEHCQICGQHPCVFQKKAKAKVKLANGKELAIQNIVSTTFWHPDVHLCLKYHNSLSDTLTDLGPPEEVGQMFASFQKYLYQQQAGM